MADTYIRKSERIYSSQDGYGEYIDVTVTWSDSNEAPRIELLHSDKKFYYTVELLEEITEIARKLVKEVEKLVERNSVSHDES